MGRLTPTLDFGALAEADLVIEAVFENMDIKKSVFEQLDGDRQARRDPGLQHLLSRHRRDRRDDEASGGRDRHAFLLAGQRDAAARDRARREDVETGARHRSRSSRRRSARSASSVGVCHGFVGNRMLAERQREAMKLILEGATPWDVDRVLDRFRHADGAVRDERPRRPRHRLVGGDVEALDDPRHPVRGGPARPEDRRRLLRLRRDAQRQTLGACREDHPRLRRLEGRQAARHLRTRRSWSAAPIR